VIDEVAEAGRAEPERRRRAFDASRGEFVEAAIHDRAALPVGTGVEGPAIIVEAETSTFVTSAFRAVVQPDGCLFVSRL
jgi:N-methylhydantoinase A